MTITCYTPPYIPLSFSFFAPAWSPGRVVSRAGKIVISAFFASSFVRNNIFCLHFTTNEHTADRQISLFGEGQARTSPNTVERQSIGRTKKRKTVKTQTLRNCEPLLDAIINISVLRFSRLPPAMMLKGTVVNAIISRRSGPTRTQEMETELTWVNPNVF